MATVIPSTGFRYYGKLYNTNHGAPSWMYLFDSGVVWQNDVGQLITGAARPVVPADLASTTSIDVSGGLSVSVGNVAVTGGQVSILNPILATSGVIQGGNSLPVSVSGVVVSSPAPIQAVSGYVTTIVTGGSVSFDSTAIVNAQTTGNARLLVADQLLSGISGQNALFLAGAPVYVTGSFAASVNSVAVTGFSPTIAPLAISGVVQASVTPNNTDVVNAITTGNARELVTNILLSGVSGQLASNLTDPAFVTGAVSITNSVLAISGIVQSSAAAVQAVSGVVSSTVTGFNTGVIVSIQPVTKASVSNLAPSGVAPWTDLTSAVTGQIFASNPARVMFFVQNIHTGTPLYVSLSANAASTGNFNFILNPSTALGYGGGSFSDDHYRGAVCVSGGGWTAYEL